jgi:hypothetical protein
MADSGVTCSSSRSGNVWDNAGDGNFFSSPKTERIARKTYRTRHRAGQDVFDYIGRFYNPTGRYSTLGYLSPMDWPSESCADDSNLQLTGCNIKPLKRQKKRGTKNGGAHRQHREVATPSDCKGW